MWLPLAVLLAFGAIGTYSLVRGGQRFLKVYHVLRNDPRPIRDVDGYRGPVEIEGRAVAGDPGTVTAPFTAAECLAYTYEVEELRSSGKTQSWKTLDAGTGGVNFVVEDGTGRVEVDPTGADVHFEDHSVTVSPGTELPDRLREFVERTPNVDPQDRTVDLRVTQLSLGNRQRFTERRLDVGEQVYVYGQATSGRTVEWGSNLVDALVADGEGTPVFVIADTDERGTAWRIARTGLWKVGIGVVTLGVVAAVGLSVLV